jgi:5-oxoprolinase (ATP-hydrolysing)
MRRKYEARQPGGGTNGKIQVKVARLALDIGGTFTDIAIVDNDGRLATFKVPTDSGAPVDAVLTALDHIGKLHDLSSWSQLLHGTTIGTNSLLEGKAPTVGLITTKGFRDVLQLRRVKRENLFSIDWDPPSPLVPRQRIFELDERIDADGSLVQELTAQEIQRAVEWVSACECASVAICLLNSYIHPAHEQELGAAISAAFPTAHVTLSSQVSPEVGEFERTSTTVAHAVLKPVLSDYLECLVRECFRDSKADRGIFVMQSNGGLATARQIIDLPANAVESGPAAGALCAARIARDLNIQNAISMDVGGTTAKACLIEDGRPHETAELRVGGGVHAGEGLKDEGGYVIRGQALGIVEVGAGGGSLCSVDEQGVLQVGPESAGADPGPAAYGLGGECPTVTDANVVLGYLVEADTTGAVRLDRGLAQEAIRKHVAEPLGVEVQDAAWLIHRLANNNMMTALQAVSSERGRNPSKYSLIAFGGGGPTHAVAIARELGITEVVVPAFSDVLSAVGLHYCPVKRNMVMPIASSLSSLNLQLIESNFCSREALLLRQFEIDDISIGRMTRYLDLRFKGQSRPLTVEVRIEDLSSSETIEAAFHVAYLAEYGYCDANAEVEVVAARVEAQGSYGDQAFEPAIEAKRNVSVTSARAYFGADTGWISCQRYDAGALESNSPVVGPALIQIGQSTAVMPSGSSASIDELGNLLIRIESERATTLPGGWEGRAGIQLFRNALRVIVDRMTYAVSRTAYSSVIYESGDFAVGICDRDGRVLDQGTGALILLGCVRSAMQELRKTRMWPLSEGDVVLLNDPQYGGTHLPDCVLARPVYLASELVGYVVVVGHMSDIGGSQPGSFAIGASELLQEGVVIPPVRLCENGVVNQDLLGLLQRNVRVPDAFTGDLNALLSAGQLGCDLFRQFVADNGAEHVRNLGSQLIDYAKERGERELSLIPNGEATFEDYLDDDGVSGNPAKLKVRIRIRGGRVTFDFRGSSSQIAAGINLTLGGVFATVQTCLRTQMSEDYPDNEGFFDLIEVIAEKGSILNPTSAAPVANRAVTAFRLSECIYGALAQLLPDRIWAAGVGSSSIVTLAGNRLDGSLFSFVDVICGTTGARPHKDGYEGLAPTLGNGRNTPAEVLEANFPVRIIAYSIVPNTGGRGKWRGGNAIRREYAILCDSAYAYIRSDRRLIPSWGLQGGEPGSPGGTYLVQTDGSENLLGIYQPLVVHRGERLIWQSAGGGGFGDSAERSRASETLDSEKWI